VKRILFVDDESSVLEGLKSTLYGRRRDWDMEFAVGGANGLLAMRNAHFDVLVTDLRMPGVDGMALVTHARTASPDTIRIVLSGYADDEQSQRLVTLAHRYLSKPCEPKRLEECIERCMAVQSLVGSDALRVKLGSMSTLPPMPNTFAALQRALADPSVDAARVSAIVQQDPSIAAKVLQVCNSAFFRLPRRVSSIQQAVAYLGLSSVRSLALSAELFKPGKALCAALDIAHLQRHSLRIAALARMLAAGHAWAEDAFLAGLLHDIGLLLLGRQFPAEMQSSITAAAAGMPLREAEEKYVGVDHGTAGAYLLGLWGLPYEIVEPVAHHEIPDRVAQSSFDILGAVAIAHALLLTVRPDDVPSYESTPPTLGDDYLRAIGLPHSWESLLARAEQLLEATELL
jgi:HD-like signal output (HDOD) protein/ActR/RegA family two-component response regulator